MNLSMAIAPWVGLLIYDGLGYIFLVVFCIFVGAIASLIVLSMKIKPRKTSKNIAPKLSLDRFILVKALPVSVNLIFCAIAYGTLISYGVLYGEEIGINNPGVMFLFMALGLGSSRIFSGRLVDKGNLHSVSVTATAILAVSFTIFALIHSVYVYSIASFLIGLGFGSISPAFQTMFVNMGTNNQRGTANSTYLTSFDVGIGIGMLMGGYISAHAGMTMVYVASASLCALALVYNLVITIPVYDKGSEINKVV
jgi:predicted MFS family arabinose efflux permease